MLVGGRDEDCVRNHNSLGCKTGLGFCAVDREVSTVTNTVMKGKYTHERMKEPLG